MEQPNQEDIYPNYHEAYSANKKKNIITYYNTSSTSFTVPYRGDALTNIKCIMDPSVTKVNIKVGMYQICTIHDKDKNNAFVIPYFTFQNPFICFLNRHLELEIIPKPKVVEYTGILYTNEIKNKHKQGCSLVLSSEKNIKIKYNPTSSTHRVEIIQPPIHTKPSPPRIQPQIAKSNNTTSNITNNNTTNANTTTNNITNTNITTPHITNKNQVPIPPAEPPNKEISISDDSVQSESDNSSDDELDVENQQKQNAVNFINKMINKSTYLYLKGTLGKETAREYMPNVSPSPPNSDDEESVTSNQSS